LGCGSTKRDHLHMRVCVCVCVEGGAREKRVRSLKGVMFLACEWIKPDY
jgi:hypothetical protein